MKSYDRKSYFGDQNITLQLRFRSTMESSDVAPKPDFFALIGDSNVKRNVTQFNCRSCPDLGKAQVILCNRLELFQESLGKLENKVNVCILACITNFLTSSEEDDNVSKRIEPVLSSFISSIKKVAEKSPSIRFLVSPPMFRKSPLWYRDGLPEVLVKFSAFMSQCNAAVAVAQSVKRS